MTYCVGVLLDEGIILASDSRTHAGVDNFASFSKMTVFERPGDRILVMLSSGNLAGTQSVVSILKQQGETKGTAPSLWNVRTMFDFARLVSDAMRGIEVRDGKYLESSNLKFDASFIIGGQIKGEAPRLFRIYAEGNFIEAGADTPFFQTGEAKYGKPIIDRVITPATTLAEATKCVLVSFDSTIRSNLSVGMPIDLICYERDSLEVRMRRRFDKDDPYFASLSKAWSEGVRTVFGQLRDLTW
jgi:putative proteasome-type protease